MKAACLFIFTAVLFGLRTSGQDYAIQLHRPLHVGQKYELSALGKSTAELLITTNGKSEQTNKTDVTVQLDATVTVLAVSDGKPIRQSLAVSRFKRTENGALKILAGSGSTVIASTENGKKVFTLNGTGVNHVEQDALELVTDLETTAPNDDLMFGTRERKKIGDSWPINTNLMMRTVNQAGSMKISSLAGKATLKDVVQEAGGPALIIEAEVVAVPSFPSTVVVDQSSATIKLSGHFPVNTALGRPEESTTMSMSFHLRKPDKKSEIKSHEIQSVTFKRTLLQ